MNLMMAHKQWATRPEDQRFSNITEMQEAISNRNSKSKEFVARLQHLKVLADDDDSLRLNFGDASLAPNNWSFSQLARAVDYPVNALDREKISAPIVADILNYRIRKLVDEDPEKNVNLYVHMDDNAMTLRSINSERYGRIYDTFVAAGIANLIKDGWKVPPARPAYNNQKGTRPATIDDVIGIGEMGLQIKEGDMIAPAGLYAGDRDLFALIYNPNHITDDGTGRKLFEAAMIWNSEVGAGTFGIMKMKLAAICGNHILWDVQDVVQFKTKHLGDADKRAKYLFIDAREKLEKFNASDNQKAFDKLRNHIIAADKTEVIDTVYDMRISPVLTKKALEAGYDMAELYSNEDGADANTPLGIMNGLTRFSQTLPNANNRWEIDNAAGALARKFSKVIA